MPEPTIDQEEFVHLIRKVLLDALTAGASDIHFEQEPRGERSRIRFRVNGQLLPATEIPGEVHKRFLAFLQTQAGVAPANPKSPHQFQLLLDKLLEQGHLGASLQCTSLPVGSEHRDFVLRFWLPSSPVGLDNFGLSRQVLDCLEGYQWGISLFSGPTDSGRATFALSTVQHLSRQGRAWRLVEEGDPQRLNLSNCTEVEVSAGAGNSFASCMAALQYMDSDVVHVGTLKGPEKVPASVDLALSGVAVVADLHANSAADALVRYLDFGQGVYRRLLVDALHCVFNQRLMPRLCPHCKQEHPLAENEIKRLLQLFHADIGQPSQTMDPDKARATYKQWLDSYGGEARALHGYTAAGCERCGQTGYRGRVAVVEAMPLTRNLRSLLLAEPSESRILELAAQEGFVSLRQDGIGKVLAGLVDLASLERMLG